MDGLIVDHVDPSFFQLRLKNITYVAHRPFFCFPMIIAFLIRHIGFCTVRMVDDHLRIAGHLDILRLFLFLIRFLLLCSIRVVFIRIQLIVLPIVRLRIFCSLQLARRRDHLPDTHLPQLRFIYPGLRQRRRRIDFPEKQRGK